MTRMFCGAADLAILRDGTRISRITWVLGTRMPGFFFYGRDAALINLQRIRRIRDRQM
jgi:hypothetical protein